MIFGDTEIRNVRGKPSHVTALEAYHMDTVGVQPSASKKSINPMTGLPEYHGSKFGGFKKSSWPAGHPAHHKTGLELLVGEKAYDVFETYAEKVEDWATDPKRYTPPEEYKLERQAEDILTGGMENLQTQYGQYMGNAGPDGIVGTQDDVQGFIEQEQDIREKGLKSTYDIAMGGYDISGKKLSESTGASYKQLRDVGNVQRSRSNLAYSGTIEGKVREGEKTIGKQYALGTEEINLGRTGTQSAYDIGMEGSALTAEKSEADFMAGLRKQMNQMMTDYISATGKAYDDTAVDPIFEELDALFDTYSANV